ncbi:MAG TPA: hypothetical protein VNJ07_01420, partial [Chitinophagales bacterium]|nr:hypothetical protein [Chitinophagales bacterium]
MFILLCMVFTWMMTARAQLTGWQYASVIEITEQQGNAYTDYQLLLTINTADLVANGMMQANGGDLRFALDCEGMTLIPFFIDTANSTLPGNTFPGSATKIWVRIPQILPFNVTKIYLFSGNSSAVSLNDFTSTFPNSLIIPTATSTTLFGTLDYDWFEVEAGATVNLLAGTPLVINSDKIKIDGIINGSGAGFAGGLSGGLNGSGPGGGVGSPSAGDGAGGGAYHGNGGNGGFNSLLFTGGSSYGSLFSVTINMGSGGGGGIDSTGGNGGGAVTFSGGDVEISGDINMSGANGRIDTASLQGTGGGAGGGILITGRFINYSGNTSVAGGDGGSDPSLNPAVGGGGGGGGGRVKAFYYNSGNVTAAIDVSGGTGGCCGAAASQNGQPGATWQEKLDDIYSITVNPMIFRQSPIVSGEDSACVGSSELYTASVVAGNTYLWTVTGGNVVSGQSTNSAEVNWIA